MGKPPQVSYGDNIKALTVYLYVIGLISMERLMHFFSELTNGMVKVSKGTIGKFIQDTAKNVDTRPLIQDLLNGEVIHVDETPIKTTEKPNKGGILEISKNTTFNAYIRTYSNEKATVLTANPRKTKESVTTDNILTQFHGIVSKKM